ncbi:MAG: FAD-binding oxidoreductase [Alphaproteobacteria bacterium]|nr:FAD-binding oxidoreductase [Alphaproteobacteria bacterium]MCW5739698.1 FAD-binding oxidoreductase [Alphaproteobacteria bacterium]
MMWKTAAFSGWGRLPYGTSEATRPERFSQLRAAMTGSGPGSLIARGLGRSYGDCAVNEGGRLVMTERLDRLVAFDAESGEVVVEAGISLRSLLDVFLPRGLMVPVCPGTAYVTVGGAIANDVHGKNHEKDGAFGAHVAWFELMLPSGEIVRVSRDSDPALFDATVGGIGLTGIIVTACLRLARVPSNALIVRERPVPDLDALLARLHEEVGATYSVAWFDALASDGNLGRGIVETATPSPTDIRVKKRSPKSLPVTPPSLVLNPLSVRAFNALYRARVPAAGRESLRGYDAFLFPLDSLLGWNRMYGKRGFRQFQSIVPAAALVPLLERIRESRAGSFLAVLKAMGPAGTGMLSFPMPGYGVALDFPNKPGIVELLGDLERITLDHGGRVYLAKDSCLSPQGFAAMYRRLPAFLDVLERVDPQRRLGSSMSRRLAIRGGAP